MNLRILAAAAGRRLIPRIHLLRAACRGDVYRMVTLTAGLRERLEEEGRTGWSCGRD
jgi:hypothetical protein